MNKKFYVTLVETSKKGIQFKENYVDSLIPMCQGNNNIPGNLLHCLEWLFKYDQHFKMNYYYESKDKIDFIRTNASYLTNAQYTNNEDVKMLKKKIVDFGNDLNEIYQIYIQNISNVEKNAYYNLIENYGNHLESSKIKGQLIKASIIEANN